MIVSFGGNRSSKIKYIIVLFYSELYQKKVTSLLEISNSEILCVQQMWIIQNILLMISA